MLLEDYYRVIASTLKRLNMRGEVVSVSLKCHHDYDDDCSFYWHQYNNVIICCHGKSGTHINNTSDKLRPIWQLLQDIDNRQASTTPESNN